MLGAISHHTMSIKSAFEESKAALETRASNYDATAEELFAELPDGIKDDPEAIAEFMDTHEVSHIISDANGGSWTINNLIWEDGSANAARGAENMTALDVETIEASNDLTAEVLTAGSEGAAELGAAEVLGAVSEAVIPAIAAVKVATAVADQFETTEDKVGYGALGAGGTVLLFSNPLTGPFAWTAAGLYGGYKLLKLGAKVVEAMDQEEKGGRAKVTVSYR